MNYSQDQQQALATIHDWLKDYDGPKAHVLTGSAGTGKTTVVKEILQYAHSLNYHLLPTALTHRAADVLQDAIGVATTTTHKAFGLEPNKDKYGNDSFKSTKNHQIHSGSFIVADEASMISGTLLKYIAARVNEFKNIKILFVGDPNQLPPVTQKCTIFDGSIPTSKLTTVHRQIGNNPILDKAIEYQKYISGETSEMPTITESILNDDGNGIHVLSHNDFHSQYVQTYVDYEAGDEIQIPMCTYTNQAALKYNDLIRKSLFFLQGTIEPFYRGEQLISNSIVKENSRTLLRNNELVTVNGYSHYTYAGISGYRVKVEREPSYHRSGNVCTVFVPSDLAAAKSEIARLQKIAKQQQSLVNAAYAKGQSIPEIENSRRSQYWRDFYALKDGLADLRSPFAGTTHKAQGGTYPGVFIDAKDINTCKVPSTKARLMYVALTRAQENAYILI